MITKPNGLIWVTLGLLSKIYAHAIGLRIKQKVKIKGAAIVLANHTSFKDYMFSTAAIYPRRINYLAAAKMFYEPSRRPFLKLAHAIPKAMFQSDPGAVKAVFQILKQKGIVGIYPEGQLSYHGTSLKSPFAIAKLLKKCRVPVYVCKIENAYLLSPPWSKKIFKGKVFVRLSQLLSPEDLDQFDDHTIYEKVEKALYYNVGDVSRQKQHQYQVQPIDGLQSLLYQCPACLHEGLHAVKHQLICPQCHHQLTYDRYGLLSDRSVFEWFEAQRQRVEKTIDENPAWTLSVPVRLIRYQGIDLKVVGHGVLMLNRRQYTYEGQDQGKVVKYEFTTKTIEYLPADLGLNVQIYYDNEVYIFEMDNPIMSTKMFIAGEYFYKLENQHQGL